MVNGVAVDDDGIGGGADSSILVNPKPASVCSRNGEIENTADTLLLLAATGGVLEWDETEPLLLGGGEGD